MRYEALGLGIDGTISKTSSALVDFISNSLCVYVCVWGRWVQSLWSIDKFHINLSLCVAF